MLYYKADSRSAFANLWTVLRVSELSKSISGSRSLSSLSFSPAVKEARFYEAHFLTPALKNRLPRGRDERRSLSLQNFNST